ncbi:hypothetical protein BD779DRAFT_1561426 [Infundibulicybe gibba]|nr:hypothetical protein BD779DRAFT_1561426 [Infundibulicybe gibba]
MTAGSPARSMDRLPLELWLHIVAYLPRGQLYKMIGVNRALFELGMNDMYREVSLLGDEREMLRTFEQLQHPSIALRVHHLCIQRIFFSYIQNTPAQPTARGYLPDVVLPRVMAWLGLGKRIMPGTVHDSTPELCPGVDLLRVATKIFAHCTRVQELTLVLKQQPTTPPLVSFFKTLWTTIGHNLRILSLEVTSLHFDPQTMPSRFSIKLDNLEELNISIALPTYDISSSSNLLPLVSLAEHSIRSLSISSSDTVDLTPFFAGLGHIQFLQRLEIRMIFNQNSLALPQTLFGVLEAHKATLQHLVINPRLPRGTLVSPHGASLGHWIEDMASSPRLPRLKTLEVGWKPYSNSSLGFLGEPLPPDLGRISVELKHLVLTDDFLTLQEFLCCWMLRGILLESLKFNVVVLSPQLFDLLASKLPHLKSLDIKFARASAIVKATQCAVSWEPLVDKGMFRDYMSSHYYADWGLKSLRLSLPAICGESHHHLNFMQAVAESIPSIVRLNVEDDCFCSQRPEWAVL